ncbi:MAG: DUF6033 family protein [Lachnospiraceae bacterium]|nr:DUF6033 family protein [Lachnospiraceae bacterium]
MGTDITSAYNQFLAGAVSAGYGPGKTAGKNTGARKPAEKESGSFRKAADVTFSKEGMAALNKSGSTGTIAQINESKLSDKAKNYLNKLRDKYGDYDFVVGNDEDDLDELMKGTSKEFSVIFSNEELERMADDEAYGESQMSRVEDAVATARKLTEELGSGDTDENGIATGTFFNRFGITLNADGTISIFAEMENVSARQREAAETAREQRAEDKKAAAKEDAKKAAEEARKERADEKKEARKAAEESVKEKAEGPGGEATSELREKYSVRFATITAKSGAELLEKVRGIDWSQIAEA